MAENDSAESTQKPKAELIKKPRPKETPEAENPEQKIVHKVIKLKLTGTKDATGEGANESESASAPAPDEKSAEPSVAPVAGKSVAPKKKVVVVKKKPRVQADQKPQGGAVLPTAHEAPPLPASGEAGGAPSAAETPQDKAASGAPTGESAPAPQAAAADGTPQKKAVMSLPVTARPTAKAGRVGGKFIGERPPREPRNTGFYNRTPSGERQGQPAGEQGYVRQGGAGYVRQGGAGYVRQGGAAGGTGGTGYVRQGGASGYVRPAGASGYVRPGGTAGGTGYVRQGGASGYVRQGGQRPGGGTQGGFAGRNFGPPGANRFVPGNRGGGAPRGDLPPLPGAEGKGPAKRSYKAKKSLYHRSKEQEMEEKRLQLKKQRGAAPVANPIPKSIDIMEIVTVSELARKMNLKASDLIQKLMRMGVMATINQQIDSETAAILAAEYGADVNIVNLYDETLIENEIDGDDSKSPRPPVVTVMGHVDHGKTKLLDAIRNADVVSGEFGGITQHIGAYMVKTPKGSITFLDTPGHEAFTRMRSRGAQVTDIVVLVVAADDGVMPQTVEAINHAKEASVPIIVAVNKIDKPEANPDRVKSQLSELGLQPEEWGGQTMFVEISALQRIGLDDLIDAILLQAEILDLKANYNRRAEGKILESRIDQGRGIVASILIQKGTLEIGDSFVAGVWPGKVRALFNDKGEKVDKAMPAMPIEVLGFEGIPNAGDPMQVVEDEKIARGYSSKRQELKRFEDAKHIKKITMENLHATISEGAIAELKVIIKGDVQGSVEALKSSLEKLSTGEVRLNVIQALPGAINEGDVDLAAASNAILIGFNVRPTPKARALADQEKVDIRKYNIIYRVVEEMQQAMEGLLKPDTKEEVIGSVEVRNVFKMSRAGTVAGCYVLSGTIKRGASVNVLRDNIVIHSGKIGSLRRFKDDVKEVSSGFECGMGIDGFDDIKEGDQFEVFEVVEVARRLSS
ncbi:MAG: translation initiation factor IF-2 [Spirochaetaceae bacterium]|jgi:translation initiation factor IF-2|nr:translation initiation factor IF-2 [Spirochaetaceae bacterium]